MWVHRFYTCIVDSTTVLINYKRCMYSTADRLVRCEDTYKDWTRHEMR